MNLPPFAPIEPGTYVIDPDLNPATSLTVTYEVEADGWSQWIGAVKFLEPAACSSQGCSGKPPHVALSITTVTNLVTHGCRNHSWSDPPIGPGVDDLATALASLAPFQVTSRPRDVVVDRYAGKHLTLTVPNLRMRGQGDDSRFTGCVDGSLKSWVAAIDAGEPGDAFYGYTAPGYVEEFWILDVKGTRLMIAAEHSPGSQPRDLAELRALVDSIRIDPLA